MIEKIKRENEEYHFIEVMTCPGGCIEETTKEELRGMKRA